MTTKFKTALGLANLAILQILALARLILLKMTGNSNFPTPGVTLINLGTAITEAQDAVDAVAAAKNALADAVIQQNDKIKVLSDLMTQEANYVDGIALGSKDIITSAGMPATDEHSPVHLGVVEDLGLTRGDDHGVVDAHWHAIRKSNGYRIEISLTAPDNTGNAAWVFYDNSSKSSAHISGQTSATGLWVRVCAIGAGQSRGGWSDVAFIVVP